MGTGSWRNQELPEYTQAMFRAREIAQNRLDAEVRENRGLLVPA